MTMPNDPDDATDDRLRNAFRAAGEPASPDLTPRVKDLIRRQRALTRIGIGAAAAFVVACVIAWQTWPRTPERPMAGVVEPAPLPRIEHDPPLPSGLFADPPVDSLGTVSRQQDAYVAVLQRLTED